MVLVTSGAIARGMRLMELPRAALGDGRAPGRLGGGPGQALPRLRRAARSEQGVRSAQVLLTFFDMSARTHYLNARHTLRKLLDWRVVPVINENDTTTTDEISFGDNDFLAAQVAILLGADLLVLLTDTDGLHTADPHRDPGARAHPRGRATSRQLDALRDRRVHLAARLGRDALEGRGGGDGHRGGHPGDHHRRHRPRMRWRARSPAAPSGTRFHPQDGREGVELQALAQVREAQPRPADGGRGGGAGAARARHEPAAGRRGGRARATSRPATRWRCAPRERPADRQGDRELLGGRAAADQGHEDRRGARAAAARHRGGRPPGLLRARTEAGRTPVP